MRRSLILSGFLVVSVISMYGMEEHIYAKWVPGVGSEEGLAAAYQDTKITDDMDSRAPTPCAELSVEDCFNLHNDLRAKSFEVLRGIAQEDHSLVCAVERQDYAIASALLEVGANPSPPDIKIPPLHRAINLRNRRLVELLLQHSANCLQRDENCLTPSDLVCVLRASSRHSKGDLGRDTLQNMQEAVNQRTIRQKREPSYTRESNDGKSARSSDIILSDFVRNVENLDGIWAKMSLLEGLQKQHSNLVAQSFAVGTNLKTHSGDVNNPDPEGIYPLGFAVEALHSFRTVALLLGIGANPNQPPHLLHKAIALRMPSIVRVLLQGGAHCREKDQHNLTPIKLARALYKNSMMSEQQQELSEIQDIIKRHRNASKHKAPKIREGDDVSHRKEGDCGSFAELAGDASSAASTSSDEYGSPPTGEHGLWHDLQRMRSFVQLSEILHSIAKETCKRFDKSDNPNQPNAEGILPLVYAITILKYLAVVRILLHLGAGPCPSVLVSPLHSAVYVQSPEIVTLLLQYGADCHRKGPHGMTPVELVSHLRSHPFTSAEQKPALLQIQAIFDRKLSEEKEGRKAARKKRHSIAFPTLHRNGHKK